MTQSSIKSTDQIQYLKSFIADNSGNNLSKSELISEAVIAAVKNSILKIGDILPTVNNAVEVFGVARKTVVRAYNILKKRGIINSKERLGYIIVSDNLNHNLRVMMLIQSFNAYMEMFYSGVVENLGNDTFVDVYFHHYNPQVFKSILRDNIGKYNKYIITSFNEKSIKKDLKKVPVNDLIICSRDEYIPENILSFIQDFDSGTYNALKQASEKIKKYDSFYLIFPKGKGHPPTIIDSFNKFCEMISIEHQVIEKPSNVELKSGQAYFVIEDCDLVKILENTEQKGLILGGQIGLLSYNDTPIKKVIRNGMSVITTDFYEMGKKAAEAALGKIKKSENLPINYLERNSL